MRSDPHQPAAPYVPDAHSILPDLLAARHRAGAMLVGLDFDGTLAHIVPTPDDAALIEGAAVVLDRLAARADTTLAIVTGRGVADARGRMGGAPIHFAGNHGMEISGPGMDWLHPEVAAARPALTALLQRLRVDLSPWEGIILEDKHVSFSVHFRTILDEREDRRIVEAVHSDAAELGGPIRLTDGKKVVEVRPDVDWDKGRALVYLRDALGLAHAPAIFIGDDRTDEDGFREVMVPPDAGIIVGDERLAETRARAMLRDPADVIRFLSGLADA